MFAKTLDLSYSDSDVVLLIETVVGTCTLCVSSDGTQCKGDPNSLFFGEMFATHESQARQNKD